MKYIAQIIVLTFVIASNAYSDSRDLVLDIQSTNVDYLSIRNMTNAEIEISVSGEFYILPASSGLIHDCASFSNLTLAVTDYNHPYTEAHCSSEVTISSGV
ncbi:MAG: hypothetical protein OEY09_14115 [Gammaproteobacteria bacterium]|nr:hypothetical protein [Gammaproteobacteria bacterium]